jgi:aconitase B
MDQPRPNNSRRKGEELRRAEATARDFLEDNAAQISETLQAKIRFLQLLVERVGQKKTTLDQRLDSFARIAEIAELLKQDADGFFNLASQPVVARILLNGRSRK